MQSNHPLTPDKPPDYQFREAWVMAVCLEKEAMIKQVPLFVSLSGVEIQYLAEILREVKVPANTLLLKEGESGDRFYIITRGNLEVVKALGTPDERLLNRREAGDFIGEMALLDPDGLRTASIRTTTPVELLEMDRTNFNALLQLRPALAYEMVRVLSLRLRDTDNTTINDLHEKNLLLSRAYQELKEAQAQLVEKEKLEHELRMARWIQESILPHTLPDLPGYTFGVRFVPARAVGGDLFDFVRLGRDTLGIVIGDVSDKGMPAAIFMALTRSLMRAEAYRSSSPSRVLQRVNHHLLEMNEAGMFVTAIYGILDRKQDLFIYSRAGHEVPLFTYPKGKLYQPAHGTGQPLGLFDNPLLDEQLIPFPSGSTMLMYTDGATDMTNPAGISFGQERLRAAFTGGLTGTAQDLCDHVWKDLSVYQAGCTQADDVALVAMRA
ncbi:MAG: SpoIIE family protein phosphatase [Anaerolineaceae bacterium]|jgi:sigma-B regulation protein RsbU (phosphoserine phosphatase)